MKSRELLLVSSTNFELSSWLKGIGMEKYKDIFDNADISDFDILKRVTDADLKEMGIDSLSDRKEILSHIEVNKHSLLRARNFIGIFSFFLLIATFLPIAQNVDSKCLSGNFYFYNTFYNDSCFYELNSEELQDAIKYKKALNWLRSLYLLLVLTGIMGLCNSTTNIFGLEKSWIRLTEFVARLIFTSFITVCWIFIILYNNELFELQQQLASIIDGNPILITNNLIAIALAGVSIGANESIGDTIGKVLGFIRKVIFSIFRSIWNFFKSLFHRNKNNN